jgi:aminoglycoside phosphotransferase (APT) family kinase protein
MSFEDTTRAVRAGEELAVEPLRLYLQDHVLKRPVREVRVEQFPGGHSNLTYLIRADNKEMVLRRPPFGSKVKAAHDMSREYRVLTALSPHVRWVPRPFAFCDDKSVMGADFYLMQRLNGVVLRRKLPDGLRIDEATSRRLAETLLDTLVELHAIDYQAVGLAELGRPEGYVTRQVEGWTKRYADSQTDEIAAMPAAAAWLAAHIPTSQAATIIHNDYKFDNVLYDSAKFEQIVGVLDWEMTTIGDPLMDLGTTLCYWVEEGDPAPLKAFSFGPTMLPGMYTRRQLADRYAEATNRDLGNILFYYVFGLFKTAVVLQQIYYRYKQGLTSDDRFAALIDGVRLLSLMAERSIERDAI